LVMRGFPLCASSQYANLHLKEMELSVRNSVSGVFGRKDHSRRKKGVVHSRFNSTSG
jgi:hypothetical protein